MKHYVYKITDPETGQFYFGSRSNENPENDSYTGSMMTWTPEDKTRLVKEIIKDDFETREDAIEFEDELIGQYIDEELNENYHRPHKGFHTHGLVPWNKGKTMSDEYKQKLKDNHWDCSGENHPQYGMTGSLSPVYGRERTADEIERIRRGNKSYHENNPGIRVGEKNPFYNKTHTEESKEKMRQSALTRNITPEMEARRRRKISETLRSSNHVRRTKVEHIESGQQFDSMTLAAKKFDIVVSTIYHHCQENRAHQKWKYVK